MSDSSITDIIFDSGGVIFTKGTDIVLRQFPKILHRSYSELILLFSGDPSWGPRDKPGELYRTGKISRDDFWNIVRERLHLDDDGIIEKMERMWLESYTPHPYMFDILAELQTRYRLTLWTGNIRERIAYLDATYDFLHYFQKTCYSFDLGWAKEEDAAYTSLLNVIAPTSPRNALVIDDKHQFVQKARKFGFNAVVFEGPKYLLSQFQEYGIDISLNF